MPGSSSGGTRARKAARGGAKRSTNACRRFPPTGSPSPPPALPLPSVTASLSMVVGTVTPLSHLALSVRPAPSARIRQGLASVVLEKMVPRCLNSGPVFVPPPSVSIASLASPLPSIPAHLANPVGPLALFITVMSPLFLLVRTPLSYHQHKPLVPSHSPPTTFTSKCLGRLAPAWTTICPLSPVSYCNHVIKPCPDCRPK